jgi:hypothetical protein
VVPDSTGGRHYRYKRSARKRKVPEKLTSPAEREKGNGSHVMYAHLQEVLPSQEKIVKKEVLGG